MKRRQQKPTHVFRPDLPEVEDLNASDAAQFWSALIAALCVFCAIAVVVVKGCTR